MLEATNLKARKKNKTLELELERVCQITIKKQIYLNNERENIKNCCSHAAVHVSNGRGNAINAKLCV